MMEILRFIQEGNLLVVAVLMALGALIKHALPMVNNRAIPLILVVFAVVFCSAGDLSTGCFGITTIYQSIFCACAAVGIHQVGKTMAKK